MFIVQCSLSSIYHITITSEENLLALRSGGAYMPPHKLRALQANITDKSGEPYQRLSWEALKKSLNGLVNKVC